MESKAKSNISKDLARAPNVSVAPVHGRSILSDIVLDFGPADVLGRLFPKAETEVRRRGVFLSFVPFDELASINRDHSDSWRPLLPCFDPEVGGVTPANGFAIVGRNDRGEAVTAHACRLYSITQSTLKDELESLRIFYNDPGQSKWPDEELRVTAPIAASTVGRVVFSGAVWYRPDYRKSGLMPFIHMIVRGVAFTRWYSDMTFSFMVPELVKSGLAARGYFTSVEWDVFLNKTPVSRDGLIRAALVSSRSDEQLQHFREFLQTPNDLVVSPGLDRRALTAKMRC